LGARTKSLACACALAAWSHAPAALAQSGGYRLELVRAEGTGSCASATTLESEVAQRLGRNPFSRGATRSIEIVVERGDGKWRARLYLRMDESEDAARLLESDAPECTELGKSVALAVALAIAPELPPPEPPRAPEPAPRPPSAAPATPPRSLHGALSLRGLVSSSLLPRAAAGAALSVSLRGELLGANVGASFFPQQRVRTGETELGFGLSTAFVSGCLWPRTREPQLWSCLGMQLGALHSVVFAPRPERPGDRPWLAASSELGVRQRLFGRLFVEAGAAAVFPLLRHRFAVASSAGVESLAFEQRLMVLEGFLGLGLRLD
jgi:hypothetical protein